MTYTPPTMTYGWSAVSRWFHTDAVSPRPDLVHMDPLDEDLIERYVRFPDTLTAEERDATKELLQSSHAARELAEFFRMFYEELDKLEDLSDPDTSPHTPTDSP